MTNLSPAVQAVLDAYGDFEAANTDAMAAALRTAAGYMFPNDTAQQCYDRILAIAGELEGL